MFKLKNVEFNNPQFLQALNLLASKNLPIKVSWNLSRLLRQCTKLETELRKKVVSLGDKYFKKNEEGNLTPIMKDDQIVQGHFETKEEGGQEKFDAEFQDLLATEVTIESRKLIFSDFENIEFPANQLAVLENVFDDGEVIPLKSV